MLNRDFKEMLSCLNAAAVEFIIVGAYALAAHGFPRATGDLDIWIRNSPANARKTLRALKNFGAPTAGLSEQDLTSPDTVFQIGVEPCRVDLLTGIDGVTFDEAWPNRVAVVIEGMEMNVLGKGELLKNKLAAGRDKDQGDIAWLRKNLNS